MKIRTVAVALGLALMIPAISAGGPLAAPGDMRLRHDLQLLNDVGAINIPLTSWPVSLGDVAVALDEVETASLDTAARLAYERIQRRLSWELDVGDINLTVGASGAVEPRDIRGFEDTPRNDGDISTTLAWLGERIAVNLVAHYAANPFDGDEFRPDGTYVGIALGNWMVTAGWQDRWLGPGRDGSLILSSNSRPPPGVGIQRISSAPFRNRWLSWIGPWSLTSFMAQLDDDRQVNDAWLFGLRGTFRPLQGVEIGITRAAQWCGDGRPCDLATFADLLIGNDNRGVNVVSADEPGNQLGGFDIRWSFPKQVPLAVYMQWIGEDGRGGGGAVGSWLRQVGVEYWGMVGAISHRTHFEVADTTCQEGGFGFSGNKPDCAYEHSIYQSGYRYKSRALAHGTDGDSLSYSIGSTLVQSAGHTWNATLRYMEINRQGQPDSRHTLSPLPQERFDFLISHERLMSFGRIYAGLGYRHIDDLASGQSGGDVIGFVRWSSQ